MCKYCKKEDGKWDWTWLALLIAIFGGVFFAYANTKAFTLELEDFATSSPPGTQIISASGIDPLAKAMCMVATTTDVTDTCAGGGDNSQNYLISWIGDPYVTIAPGSLATGSIEYYHAISTSTPSEDYGYVRITYIGDRKFRVDNYECYEYTNATECWAHGVDCFWDTHATPNDCKTRGYYENQCGDYQLCQFCTTEAACQANSSCAWNDGWWDKFRALTDENPFAFGCVWQHEFDTFATSSDYSTNSISALRRHLEGTIPFAYFFYIQDTLDYWALTPASGTLTGTGWALTFPTTTYNSTTILNSFVLSAFDADLFYSIAPLSFWTSVRAALNITIWVALGFWIYKQLKRENLF